MNRQVLPEITDWATMRAQYRWTIPENFNIAEACCDSWARSEPERVAIIHRGADRTEWTYGQLKRASDGLAADMRARGVERGDRVAVLLAQCPEVLITHMAAYKLGAIVLPLFTLFGCDALSYRLRDSGARVVVMDAGNINKINEIRLDLPDLSEVYSIDEGVADALSFTQALQHRGLKDPVVTRAEDPACLIYTSGTTGDPKGVLHAHRFLIGHMPAIEVYFERFPRLEDVGWTPADWAWIGGLMDMAMPCLYYGVPLISHRMRKFEPDAAYRLIKEERANCLFLPPTALKLMRQAEPPPDLGIRAIFSGGEPLGADLLQWAREVLGATINEGYGQTECNLVLGNCGAVMDIRPGSMGRAIPGHDVAIIGSRGEILPEGEMGEIAVRGGDPVMFLKYWRNPDKTTEKFAGDWMRTGDLGVRDADGYFWFASRDDDIINSSGYRIGPAEIENCLNGHDDVVMAAVVGVPDPVRGEAIKAFIVVRDGAKCERLEAALIARVRERLSPHLAPRAVERIEALPMTATGKIMRRALRHTG